MFLVLIGLPVSPATALMKTLQLVMNELKRLYSLHLYGATCFSKVDLDLDLKWKNIQTNHEIRCMYT